MGNKSSTGFLQEFWKKQAGLFRAYLLVAAFVILFIIVLYPDRIIFLPYTAGVNPLFAALLIASLGGLLLWLLVSNGDFKVYQKKNFLRLLRIVAPALFFAPVAILVDIIHPFPRDINVLFPESLLFYPVVALFAEVIFHLLPFTLAFLSFHKRIATRGPVNRLALIFGGVALVETAYQAIPMIGSGDPFWAVLVVGLNVYFINLYQFRLFRKHDFITMYSFRVMYYLAWHITWGYFRLILLY